ncbi:MAG: hypothetical protein ACK451_22670, partial [Pseudanabaena sp.]
FSWWQDLLMFFILWIAKHHIVQLFIQNIFFKQGFKIADSVNHPYNNDLVCVRYSLSIEKNKDSHMEAFEKASPNV